MYRGLPCILQESNLWSLCAIENFFLWTNWNWCWGLLRQFYTSSINKISDSLFEGKPGKLVPKCDANTCLSEIYVVVGKMISHNIAQKCAGFPLLSEACFRYLCTGSLKDASIYINVDEVASSQYEYYIKEVCLSLQILIV